MKYKLLVDLPGIPKDTILDLEDHILKMDWENYCCDVRDYPHFFKKERDYKPLNYNISNKYVCFNDDIKQIAFLNLLEHVIDIWDFNSYQWYIRITGNASWHLLTDNGYSWEEDLFWIFKMPHDATETMIEKRKKLILDFINS